MHPNAPEEGHQDTLLVCPVGHKVLKHGEQVLSVELVHATDSYLCLCVCVKNTKGQVPSRLYVMFLTLKKHFLTVNPRCTQ